MSSSHRSDALDLTGRRLLVTGGTGFVGRGLLDYLIESTDAHGRDLDVCVLSRTPGQFLHDWPRYANRPWLRFHAGDMLGALPPAERFTDVIHAAADSHSRQSGADWVRQIVDGTRAALDFAMIGGAERFLMVSSGAVYGPQPPSQPQLPEDWPGAPSTNRPSSTYGQAKRVAEQLCSVYCHERGLQTVIARCFALIGPHIPLDGPFAAANFIRDGLDPGCANIRVRGNGQTVRSYLDGRDAAHWLVTMLRHGAVGEAYNLGSDIPVTTAALAHRIAAATGNKPVSIENQDADNGARSYYVPSIAKAASLGLAVETDLDAAIAGTVRAFRT